MLRLDPAIKYKNKYNDYGTSVGVQWLECAGQYNSACIPFNENM